MWANLITFTRLILGIFMMIFAYLGNTITFVVLYCLALISDLLDGSIARKLKITSDFGKKFDVLADNFIVICLIVSFYFFKLDLLRKYKYVGLFLFSYFLIVQIISKIKTKKLIFMRTYTAQLAAILFPFLVFISILIESRILIYSYVIIMVYSLTEKLFLQIRKMDKKSIFQLKSNKIRLIFILAIMLLITLLFFIPLTDRNDKACFEDGYCVNLDIKDTPEERTLGLMFREYLDEKDALLFIFEHPAEYSFWMKNMKIPIDMIFLNENKEIITIHRKVPPCYTDECELYTPISPVIYVIETKAGFSDIHNLKVGQIVSLDIAT